MAEDIRYFASNTGMLHKRRYGLNVSGAAGNCRVSNDSLAQPVSAGRIKEFTGDNLCAFCFPRTKEHDSDPDPRVK